MSTVVISGMPQYVTLTDFAYTLENLLNYKVNKFHLRDLPSKPNEPRRVAIDCGCEKYALTAMMVLDGYKYKVANGRRYELQACILRNTDIVMEQIEPIPNSNFKESSIENVTDMSQEQLREANMMLKAQLDHLDMKKQLLIKQREILLEKKKLKKVKRDDLSSEEEEKERSCSPYRSRDHSHSRNRERERRAPSRERPSTSRHSYRPHLQKRFKSQPTEDWDYYDHDDEYDDNQDEQYFEVDSTYDAYKDTEEYDHEYDETNNYDDLDDDVIIDDSDQLNLNISQATNCIVSEMESILNDFVKGKVQITVKEYKGVLDKLQNIVKEKLNHLNINGGMSVNDIIKLFKENRIEKEDINLIEELLEGMPKINVIEVDDDSSDDVTVVGGSKHNERVQTKSVDKIKPKKAKYKIVFTNLDEKTKEDTRSVPDDAVFSIPIRKLFKEMKMLMTELTVVGNENELIIAHVLRGIFKDLLKDKTYTGSCQILELYREKYPKTGDKEFLQKILEDINTGKYKDIKSVCENQVGTVEKFKEEKTAAKIEDTESVNIIDSDDEVDSKENSNAAAVPVTEKMNEDRNHVAEVQNDVEKSNSIIIEVTIGTQDESSDENRRATQNEIPCEDVTVDSNVQSAIEPRDELITSINPNKIDVQTEVDVSANLQNYQDDENRDQQIYAENENNHNLDIAQYRDDSNILSSNVPKGDDKDGTQEETVSEHPKNLKVCSQGQELSVSQNKVAENSLHGASTCSNKNDVTQLKIAPSDLDVSTVTKHHEEQKSPVIQTNSPTKVLQSLMPEVNVQSEDKEGNEKIKCQIQDEEETLESIKNFLQNQLEVKG